VETDSYSFLVVSPNPAAVESYLRGKEHRAEVLAACETELRDLGMWPL